MSSSASEHRNKLHRPEYLSWGRTVRAKQYAVVLEWQPKNLPEFTGSYLPYGAGRSYGDVCLNPGGTLLVANPLDRLISFDPLNCTIECEAGVQLSTLLDFLVPRGFFLPVVPGTAFVTVGGAIANDIHGKNHHSAGTFGNQVLSFKLLRSDGSVLTCSLDQNPEMFAASIGGLGLTGLIITATLKIRPIANPYITSQAVPFESLEQFSELSEQSDRNFEYTVAWIDSLSSRVNETREPNQLKGIFFRGNHCEVSTAPAKLNYSKSGRTLAVPLEMPGWLLNSYSIKLFNKAYYGLQERARAQRLVHYRNFFFPLDGIRNWNLMYGRRGFYQFQCVVPDSSTGIQALHEILTKVKRAKSGSFLSVLKKFGAVASPGMLSFPRPGFTLALDLPNQGDRSKAMILDLISTVDQVSGAVYPAKDAVMGPESFRRYFLALERFKRCVDSKASSSFWRRVTGAH